MYSEVLGIVWGADYLSWIHTHPADSEPISSSAICCVNSHSKIFLGAVLFRFWLKSLKYGESIGATLKGPWGVEASVEMCWRRGLKKLVWFC